jgi:hypothetical protein
MARSWRSAIIGTIGPNQTVQATALAATGTGSGGSSSFPDGSLSLSSDLSDSSPLIVSALDTGLTEHLLSRGRLAAVLIPPQFLSSDFTPTI